MQDKEQILEQLKALLVRKKSRQYYADKLGITTEEVEILMELLRGNEKDEKEEEEVYWQPIPGSINKETIIKRNIEKGTIEVNAYYDHAPSEEEVIIDHNIDTKNYKLSGFWSKGTSKGWLVSAFFTKISVKEEFTDRFGDFLKKYKSTHVPVPSPVQRGSLPGGCLILNHQDAHLNKYDTTGDNDIIDRFNLLYDITAATLEKATVTNQLEKIIYVIGSDCFNSEFTNATTKGTPQENILPYHVSFQAICDYQTKIIDLLLRTSPEVEIIYVPGNHDHYVGFHMVSWLKAYYRAQYNLTVDISPDFTKYRLYSNTAMCFNHGDVQKPSMLAQNFPIEFKMGWAISDHYVIFTGDKHNELVKSLGAIKFYQLPALSKAKSMWDSKQGYTTTPAEMVSFLITPGRGITSIFKEVL